MKRRKGFLLASALLFPAAMRAAPPQAPPPSPRPASPEDMARLKARLAGLIQGMKDTNRRVDALHGAVEDRKQQRAARSAAEAARRRAEAAEALVAAEQLSLEGNRVGAVRVLLKAYYADPEHPEVRARLIEVRGSLPPVLPASSRAAPLSRTP